MNPDSLYGKSGIAAAAVSGSEPREDLVWARKRAEIPHAGFVSGTHRGLLLLIPVLVLGIVLLGGGIHHRIITIFVPVDYPSPADTGDFQLSIFPEFEDGGSGRPNPMIPRLYYLDVWPSRGLHMAVQTRATHPPYHYEGKVKVIVNDLTVTNERGRSFSFIDPSSPRQIGIGAFAENYGQVHLKLLDQSAPFEGEVIDIRATGTVFDAGGGSRKFDSHMKWKLRRTTEFGPAIKYAE